jgi:hypothetical protein
MMDAFRLGGWGMYPTTLVGLILFVTAVRFARSGDRATLPLIRHLSILTALVGSLGFVTGVIKTFISCSGASPSELPMFVVVGTGESLCNVGLALVVLVMARIATSVGIYRGTQSGASLVDPHGPHAK